MGSYVVALGVGQFVFKHDLRTSTMQALVCGYPDMAHFGAPILAAMFGPIGFKIHSLVTDRHRSREFIQFLALLDAAYSAHTAIKLILDNHSAHISQETHDWLAEQRHGRFELVFTPKHGSWLNLIEGFFSKLARSVLRHIRVASVQELKDRLTAAIDHFNRNRVVNTWSYKLDRAA